MISGNRRCTESNVKVCTPSLAASGRGSGESEGGLQAGMTRPVAKTVKADEIIPSLHHACIFFWRVSPGYSQS